MLPRLIVTRVNGEVSIEESLARLKWQSRKVRFEETPEEA